MKTEITEQTMFKWLLPKRITTFQGTPWPVAARQWTPTVPNPKLCIRGWHLATYVGLREFVKTDGELWVALGRGERRYGDTSKVAYESVKLVEIVGVATRPLLVRWAADCASRVLPIYEEKYPNDDRVRKAIEAAIAWSENPNDENARAAYAAAARAAAANAAYAAYAAYAADAAAYADAAAARAAYAAAARAAYAAANAAANADAYAYAAAVRAVRAVDAARWAADAARFTANADAYAAAARAAYAAADANVDANAEKTWQSSRLIELLSNGAR